MPIFLIISNLTLNLKNKKKKLLVIFIISISSISNNYLEIFERKNSKPEFNKSFETIAKSRIKNVLIKSPVEIEEIIFNYVVNTKTSKLYNLNFYKQSDIINHTELWLTCYKPINSFKCSPDKIIDEAWNKSDVVEFNLIQSSLYKK